MQILDRKIVVFVQIFGHLNFVDNLHATNLVLEIHFCLNTYSQNQASGPVNKIAEKLNMKFCATRYNIHSYNKANF